MHAIKLASGLKRIILVSRLMCVYLLWSSLNVDLDNGVLTSWGKSKLDFDKVSFLP